MAAVIKFGELVNDNKQKALEFLGSNLPNDFIIFYNLELSNQTGFPYEFDIIIIGHYAVYSIDIKEYTGTIRGNAQDWQLDSGEVYKNPILLENKKAKALKDRLCRFSVFLNDIYVQPLIVLNDNNVKIYINDEQTKGDKRIVLRLNETREYVCDSNRLRLAPIPQTIAESTKSQIREAVYKQFSPLRPRNKIGDYLKLQTINHNNLYTTLLAGHPLYPNQRFALKVYHLGSLTPSDKLDKYKKWFIRDANALLRLRGHQNIVQTYAAFLWQDNNEIMEPELLCGQCTSQNSFYDVFWKRKEVVSKSNRNGAIYMGKTQRQHQQIAELQQRWNLLSQKLSKLEHDKILETRTDEKFRIEHLIDEIKAERQQVDQQLADLETKFSSENRGVVDNSAGLNDDKPQIVLPLEWIDGYSLRGLLDEKIEMTFRDRISIVLQVALALEYTHTNGVIHRDVRPDNIVVLRTKNVSLGDVKLVNFDCARIKEGDFTTINSLIGRQIDQRYVAPEMRINVSAASPASDQYSLGTVLFEILTGELPPLDRSLPANQNELDLSSDICEIINTMRNSKPNNRYSNMREVIQSLSILIT